MGSVRGRRLRRAALLAVVVALSATTLIGGSADATFVSAAPKITKGGKFTFIMGTDPGTFDSTKQGSISTQGPMDYPVYDALATLDPKTAAFVPLVLQSLTGSPDATVWTFKLRPNVKFSDGTPFDSAALKATFDYHAASAGSGGRALALSIASWDVTNPLVAIATLKAPLATFPLEVVGRIEYPLSPTALAKYGANYGTSPETTVGVGPFTVQSYTRGSEIVYARNPNYWNAPKPYLDTVTIHFISDQTSAYNTLLTGGADAYQSPSQTIDDQAKAAGMAIEQYYYNAVTFHSIYFMNLAKAPFNDLLARQAVYAALDPKKVAAVAGRPLATAIFDKASPWYSPNGTFPKYDAKKAQDLINQWSAKNGGAPLEFTVTDITGNTTLGGWGEAIQAALAGYQNLKVNVQQVTAASLAPLGPSGNFDLYPSAVGGVDPTAAYDSAYPTGGSRNFGKYSNPEMDAALTAGHSTTNQAQRQKAYATVQKLLTTDLPTWFMPFIGFSSDHWLVSNKAVQNWGGGQWTGPLVSQIWLKTKK